MPFEVGAKFYSDVAGTISAVRFYKAAKNTGTHVGNVWSMTGQRLATATFSGESATGWQTVNPVSGPGCDGEYDVRRFLLRSCRSLFPGHRVTSTTTRPRLPRETDSTDSAPLHFTRSVPGTPNGFYRYGSSSAFPDQIYDAEYYWVDAVFNPAGNPAPAVSSVSPADGATGVAVAVKPAATFNQAVTGSSVVFGLKDAGNAAVAGTVSYDSASNTAAFTPGSALAYGTTYTATVSGATNASGQAMAAPYSWTFTTAAAPAAPAVSSVSPANGATGVDVAVKPAATFNQAVTGSSVVFGLKDAGNAAVAGTVAYDSASNTAAFTPGSALAYGTTYTATVSGATNATGQTMAAPYSWTFTTAAAPTGCPCSVFSATSVPSTVTVNDANAVELGMKFRSDVAGTVTGVRFYKGSSNTGTHTGHLWSASGTLLASVTFSGETSSGWQQATFSSPVAITANTTYVVSYQAPNGFYSANGGYFSSAADKAPLHGLATGTDGSNGVYKLRPHCVPQATATTTPTTGSTSSSTPPRPTRCRLFRRFAGERCDGCGCGGEACGDVQSGGDGFVGGVQR